MKRMAILFCGLMLITSTLMFIGISGGSGTEEQNTVIVAPGDGSEVSGTVTLTVEVMACYCSDTTSMFVGDQYISEGTRDGMSDDGTREVFIHEWDSTGVEDGDQKIVVFGKHSDFSDQITLNVNNNGGKELDDIVKIISPEDNTEVKGTVTITAEILACFCNSTSSVFIDGKRVGEMSLSGLTDDGKSDIFEYTWDSKTVLNGGHEIKVLGKHEEQSDSVTVFVCNEGEGTPPEFISFISHQNKDTSNGKITFKVEVQSTEDAQPTSLLVNDEFVSEGQHLGQVDYDGETYDIFQHEWDSSLVEDGMYTIKVVGPDNEQYDEIELYVQNDGSKVDDIKSDDEQRNAGAILWSAIFLLVGFTSIIIFAMRMSRT
jgi:hypothetical protein